MSIYHREKCNKKELKQFRGIVKKYLDENKLPYKKLLALASYDGEVRVYTGRTIESIPQKRSKKLVAFKNTEGKWEGDMEAVKAQGGKGDGIFILDYHSKKEIQFFPVYRSDWGKDEKRELKDWLEKEEWVRKKRAKSNKLNL